jgi:hypothetical protein
MCSHYCDYPPVTNGILTEITGVLNASALSPLMQTFSNLNIIYYFCAQ